MFDLPKAVHFAAFHKRQRFADADPVGLDLRWAVANKCRSAGVMDMLHLTRRDYEELRRVLREFNTSWSRHHITVSLIIDIDTLAGILADQKGAA